MTVNWRNKWRWYTTFNADSVEWCPVEPYRDVLVCGTYQLEKTEEEGPETKNQTRLGRIYLFKIDSNAEKLSPIQTVDTAGVLDQKWCYHTIQGYPVLAVVTSVGILELYRLIDDGTHLELWLREEIGENLLALSIDWSTNKSPAEPKLVVSDSSGSVSILTIDNVGLSKVGTWKSHTYEAWIGAFNYWNTDTFYSGGDDCVFKSYDVRVPQVAVTTDRSHEAGVTAVRSHVDAEHQLLTGSYDEKVRLWDTRNLKRCVTETAVGGGVWRLKWHPHHAETILAACMYGGYRVLSAGDELSVVCEYMEHESIAYGADWKVHGGASVVATCSFYDCKMHIDEIYMDLKISITDRYNVNQSVLIVFPEDNTCNMTAKCFAVINNRRNN